MPVSFEMTRDGNYTVAVNVDEPAWAPTSVFGSILTMRHQLDILEQLQTWGYWSDAMRQPGRLNPTIDRDRRIVRAARRWSGDPLVPPASNIFVPGDVAAIRLATVDHDIAHRARDRLERIETGDPIALDGTTAAHVALDSIVSNWLYDAVPYFLNVPSLVGLVDCEPPSSQELADIRLPAPAVAVYFGADLEVPAQIVIDDDTLDQFAVRDARATEIVAAASGAHVDISADDAPPSVIPAPMVWIKRNRAPAVCGVVMHADTAGRLDDIVMWLVSCPGAAVPNRYAIYGRLSSSTLSYVAHNLAAAVAWGQWSDPALDVALPDIRDRRFRDVIRTSKFRKREPLGGAVGVKVLDAQRTFTIGKTTPTGTHVSPHTHRRRGYRRRQRVGPRDNWHYEMRVISPTIVNPGHETNVLVVRRLPPPP